MTVGKGSYAGPMPLPLSAGFEGSAALACRLATRPEVAARWCDESACEGMTIGGLADHVVAQVSIAVSIPGGPPSELAPITLAEHYRRAGWVRHGQTAVVRALARPQRAPSQVAAFG